jgi:hypothetical protein
VADRRSSSRSSLNGVINQAENLSPHVFSRALLPVRCDEESLSRGRHPMIIREALCYLIGDVW